MLKGKYIQTITPVESGLEEIRDCVEIQPELFKRVKFFKI